MFSICADFLTHSPKMARFFIALFAIFLGLTGGTYVYAKYYSLSAKEGIAIATGVYFTANYAHDANGEFVESLVNIGYRGGDATFSFEVRNYENNLLFNTDNVNIPYIIEMWLESDAAAGTEYSVSVGDGVNDTKQVLRAGEENRITIPDQSITGGSAKSNNYYISLSAPADHVAIPIYVRVQTLEGSLISRTLTGKMLLNSSAVTESKIQSQGFVIPEEPADMSEFARLDSLSAFTYEILTVGSASSSGATEELKVSWDPNILTIDVFDKAYMAWEERTGENKPLTDENGWHYIVIEIMPYAAENISFFRGAKYEETFSTTEEDAIKLENLHQCIIAKKSVTSS